MGACLKLKRASLPRTVGLAFVAAARKREKNRHALNQPAKPRRHRRMRALRMNGPNPTFANTVTSARYLTLEGALPRNDQQHGLRAPSMFLLGTARSPSIVSGVANTEDTRWGRLFCSPRPLRVPVYLHSLQLPTLRKGQNIWLGVLPDTWGNGTQLPNQWVIQSLWMIEGS